jgi:hypothetical protein
MFSQRNLEQNLLIVFGELDYLLYEGKHANNHETVQLTEQYIYFKNIVWDKLLKRIIVQLLV